MLNKVAEQQATYKRIRAKLKKAASTSSERVHILPMSDGWVAKIDGASNIATYPSKEALIRAFKNSRFAHYEMILHEKDGSYKRIA